MNPSTALRTVSNVRAMRITVFPHLVGTCGRIVEGGCKTNQSHDNRKPIYASAGTTLIVWHIRKKEPVWESLTRTYPNGDCATVFNPIALLPARWPALYECQLFLHIPNGVE